MNSDPSFQNGIPKQILINLPNALKWKENSSSDDEIEKYLHKCASLVATNSVRYHPPSMLS